MSTTHTTCTNCNTDLQIVEEKLFFPEKKHMETAYCPVCDKAVFKGNTDGWYFVINLNSKNKLDKSCLHPMA